MKRFLASSIAFMLTLLLWTSALASSSARESEEPTLPELQTRVSAVPATLAAPGKGTLRLEIKVPSGYHIFSDETLEVKLPSIEGVAFGRPVYPKGHQEEDRPVLRGAVVVEIPVTLSGGAPDVLAGVLSLDWQACQEFGKELCFLPSTDKVPFKIAVERPPHTGVQAGVPERAEGSPSAEKEPRAEPGVTPSEPGGQKAEAADLSSSDSKPSPPAKPAEASSAEAGYAARFARAAKENVPLALFIAFLFGILSSLTPCVYPVIPITVAYIGSRSEGRGKWGGFTLSLAFVAGLALVYATLGALSAKAGQAFGSLTQTPWVGVPIAAIFFVLSLSMFNLFEFKTPGAFTNRIEQTKQRGKGRGFLGAFLIGALSGLVASPCIGPLILAILVVVAATGSVALGFVYLLAFALGMGILFIVIGTFSGVLGALPKSGGWMDGVRIFFGGLILGAAFYFGGLFLPRSVFWLASGLALGFVVGYLFFGASRHFFPPAFRAAGAVLCAAALAGVVPLLPATAHEVQATGVAWQQNIESSLALARTEKMPALLDFRADWCVACVELEKKTWTDPAVQSMLSGVVPVRLDMTKNTPANRELMKRYGVFGLPTVILLAPDGSEVARFVSFKSPEEVLAWYRASFPGSAP